MCRVAPVRIRHAYVATNEHQRGVQRQTYHPSHMVVSSNSTRNRICMHVSDAPRRGFKPRGPSASMGSVRVKDYGQDGRKLVKCHGLAAMAYVRLRSLGGRNITNI